MSRFDEMRLEYSQIAKNKAIRLVICLCVDASASMMKENRMQTVNREIGAFLQKMYHNKADFDAPGNRWFPGA